MGWLTTSSSATSASRNVRPRSSMCSGELAPVDCFPAPAPSAMVPRRRTGGRLVAGVPDYTVPFHGAWVAACLTVSVCVRLVRLCV